MHVLAAKGAVDALASLSACGIDVCGGDKNGETLLFFGLGTGARYDSLIRLFVQNNGDINATNKLGVN